MIFSNDTNNPKNIAQIIRHEYTLVKTCLAYFTSGIITINKNITDIPLIVEALSRSIHNGKYVNITIIGIPIQNNHANIVSNQYFLFIAVTRYRCEHRHKFVFR